MAAAPASQVQSLADLRDDQAAPGNGLTCGTGHSNPRYSPPKAINGANVAKLTPVWNDRLRNSQGQEPQPIIDDGVMFVTTHTSASSPPPMPPKCWPLPIGGSTAHSRMATCSAGRPSPA